MICKIFLIILVLTVLPVNHISGQSEIKRLTLSVTDTTLPQLRQANDIFNWITTHIRYDAKSFQHHKYPHLTAEELIRKKKGLCNDYAGLMTEMCRSVNIEAYTIKGYIKGYGYNKTLPFLRANHTWNIIHADDSWIIADPTWGSGFIEEKAGIINKLLFITLHIPVSEHKLVFRPLPDQAFFNMNPDSLIKTHYPLDPKWLFNENPVRFYYFETGQFPVDTIYPGFLAGIYESRNLTAAGFEKQEGIMGHAYNTHNYYDIAVGHLAEIQNFNFERAVTKHNLDEFEQCLTTIDHTAEWLSRHKALTDSVYRNRLTELAKVNTMHQKLYQKTTAKANSVIKSYRTAIRQMNKMNTALAKKQNNYYIKIEKAELKKLYPEKRVDSMMFYPSGLYELQQQIATLQYDESFLKKKEDSLFRKFDVRIVADTKIDSQLVISNNAFGILIDQLYSAVLKRNEVQIKTLLDSAGIYFQHLMFDYNRKSASKSAINASARQYFNESSDMHKVLNQQATVLKQISKKTGNTDTTVNKHNAVIDRLISSYNKSIAMAEKMKAYNQQQLAVKHAEMMALKKHKKSFGRENKHFIAWYKSVYDWNKMKYASEKTIAAGLIAQTARYRKQAELKVKAFKP